MPQFTDPDFALFSKDPEGFILKHQDFIGGIVVNCIKSGMFPLDQKEDLIQSVNLHLLRKTGSIRAQYGGSTLFRTYLSVVIRNYCLVLRGQADRRPKSIREVAEEDGEPIDPTDRYSIELARSLFRAILLQFGRRLPNLLFCMKLRLRMLLTEDDIRAWWPRCTPRDLSRLLGKFGSYYEDKTDLQVFTFVSPFFSAAEGKVRGGAAIRRWATLQMEHIAQVLNSAIPGSFFDKKSVEILFEDFFSISRPGIVHTNTGDDSDSGGLP